MEKLLVVGVCLTSASCNSSLKIHRDETIRQVQWAESVAPYAMLSMVVYDGQANDNPEQYKDVPISQSLEELPKTVCCLEKEVRARLFRDGWKRIRKFEPGDVVPKSSRGLYFEVWTRPLENEEKEIVFVFEGTNFKELSDWRANLRWFRPWRKITTSGDQYDAVLEYACAMHRELLREEKGKVRFVTTGHSLGGGLAQQVYYAGLPNMERAVVFDTTPVTGFRDLAKDQRTVFYRQIHRDEFPTYRVLRVHEDGEILEFLRNFTQWFYKRDSLIWAVEFKSQRLGGSVKRHAIARLVSKILETELVAEQKLKNKGTPTASKLQD